MAEDKTLSTEDAEELQSELKQLRKDLKATTRERDELKASDDGALDAKETTKQLAELSKRLKTVEKERDELKNAGLSEQEKREQDERERKERESGLAKTNRNLRVQLAAARLNIVDPEAVSLLLDWDTVENPDDPKAVERAIKELVKDREYLIADNDAGGGAGRKAPVPGEDMDSLIRGAAGRVAA